MPPSFASLSKATVKGVEWQTAERLKAALVAKLSAAKQAGDAELTAGLFKALALVHEFIKTGARDVEGLKAAVAHAIKDGAEAARRDAQLRRTQAVGGSAADATRALSAASAGGSDRQAGGEGASARGPHGGFGGPVRVGRMTYANKLAALSDKRGFALTDPEERWTIPNDLLEKQARTLHNEYWQVNQAKAQLAKEEEEAKKARKRAEQRELLSRLDAQVAQKDAARAAHQAAMHREQLAMDQALVDLQAQLVREAEARMAKRDAFNAQQRVLVEQTKARKRAEVEADEEDNKSRMARVMEANAADAAARTAKEAANKTLLRAVQADNVRRKAEQTAALMAQVRADEEMLAKNARLLEAREAARAGELAKVREMQMKKFLAAGGEALEKGLAEKIKESEVKAAREMAAANAKAESDAQRRLDYRTHMSRKMKETLVEQMAEREAAREAERQEMLAAKERQRLAAAALKQTLRDEKAAREAKKRALHADIIGQIKSEKDARYNTYEEHMPGVEIKINKEFLALNIR